MCKNVVLKCCDNISNISINIERKNISKVSKLCSILSLE